MLRTTYLPAESKYIDNGKLDDSENDSAACQKQQQFSCTAYFTIMTGWSQKCSQNHHKKKNSKVKQLT